MNLSYPASLSHTTISSNKPDRILSQASVQNLCKKGQAPAACARKGGIPVKEQEQLGALLPSRVITDIERIHMPYLGYHLLREKLTSTLLGESEQAILHWLGKDIGRQIPIQSAAGLVMPFIRLGLGKLDVLEEGERHYRYRLTHTIFSYMPPERILRSLALECGIIAGAVNRWQGREPEVRMELAEKGSVLISLAV
jgi:hypothetical protein